MVRSSVHYYNTDSDIDALIEAIAELCHQPRATDPQPPRSAPLTPSYSSAKMLDMRLRRELAGGWNPPDLSSLVAVVAGASYGVGRGVCEVLGQCGATIYVTGRSTRRSADSPARWTVEDTAELVDRTRRMIQYLARELDQTDVSAVLVYLGWVRTVNMGMGFDPDRAGLSEADFLAITQSPQLVGRAIAELAADSSVRLKSGGRFYCGDLALEYGFTDVDGRIPACEGGELQPDIKQTDQPGKRGRRER